MNTDMIIVSIFRIVYTYMIIVAICRHMDTDMIIFAICHDDMLRKGAIRIAIPKENQLLINIFIRRKKDGEFRPIIHLKKG